MHLNGVVSPADLRTVTSGASELWVRTVRVRAESSGVISGDVAGTVEGAKAFVRELGPEVRGPLTQAGAVLWRRIRREEGNTTCNTCSARKSACLSRDIETSGNTSGATSAVFLASMTINAQKRSWGNYSPWHDLQGTSCAQNSDTVGRETESQSHHHHDRDRRQSRVFGSLGLRGSSSP